MKTKLLLLATLTALSTTGFAQLIGNTFTNAAIYDVNQSTGAATNPRSTGLTSQLAGISFQPGTGDLYGLTTLNGGQPSSLVRINPATGATNVVGSTGLVVAEGDLAFNPLNGNLYGIQAISSNRSFFQINVATGAATVLGTLPNADFSALAFNMAGVLYAIETTTNTLSTLNPVNGLILTSVALSSALGSLVGLAFDPATGIAYVGDGGSGTNLLYTLNTITGALTPIGPTGLTDLAGLAFRPSAGNAVPEGGATLGLLALSAGALCVAARRRPAPPPVCG
ncbi:MAG: DUF4394 domain-containing protein [Verrucomicrobiota bacterium]|nr:DUF4394 domain-containing protein [Verrucomicrobiota bacterium]